MRRILYLIVFTGIVQAVGSVVSFEDGVLIVDPLSPSFLEGGFEAGESISVNGCCLTVVDGSTVDNLKFELSPETIARTAFAGTHSGDSLNLERAMSHTSRFGGHIVSGHVDATAEIISVEPQGNSVIYRVRVPHGGERYLIDKGSVTIDGISLTVVEPEGNEFKLWIIPHTVEHTNLKSRTVGSKVNVEYDQVAKYLEKLSASYVQKDMRL